MQSYVMLDLMLAFYNSNAIRYFFAQHRSLQLLTTLI